MNQEDKEFVVKNSVKMSQDDKVLDHVYVEVLEAEDNWPENVEKFSEKFSRGRGV